MPFRGLHDRATQHLFLLNAEGLISWTITASCTAVWIGDRLLRCFSQDLRFTLLYTYMRVYHTNQIRAVAFVLMIHINTSSTALSELSGF